jgi:hypothetical protein
LIVILPYYENVTNDGMPDSCHRRLEDMILVHNDQEEMKANQAKTMPI